MERKEESPGPLDVMAVGAHPDDMEIACGGTLARLVEQGYRVGMVDLTDGEPTPLSPGPHVRLAEAEAAAELLGVHHRITLDLPNRQLFDSFAARIQLATLFRRYCPRLVISLSGRTPLASPDHWQAAQITDAAVFYARLTKWDDQFSDTEPHRIASQLYATLPNQPPGMPDTPGQLVVDITTTLAKKLSSVRAYGTQFPPEKEYLLERIETTARHLGQSAGVGAAELLLSPRLLPTRDLMRFMHEGA